MSERADKLRAAGVTPANGSMYRDRPPPVKPLPWWQLVFLRFDRWARATLRKEGSEG